MELVRALHAERLKLKRTLAFLLAPVAPLVIVALQLAVVLDSADLMRQNLPADPWSAYAGQVVFLWTMLMLPLFVTLETALLANLEHANGQWKHLFALPVSRGAVYAAKQVAALVLIGISMATLYIYLVGSGLVLRVVVPGLGLEAPVPWLPLLRYVVLAFVACWLILAIHTWVALRWHSFVVASTVGIIAMVVAVFIFRSDTWNAWYPWTLPGLVTNRLEDNVLLWRELLFGGLGGIVFALLGGWDVTRRDVV
ncbi:MAG TPA: ABC transporter permease [Anaerolineae bacterium]|nr:ABC transporter permease [Anaerolineae bacterium]